jgi:hypothetical protein
MNRENLSEFVQFISNHCYINSTIKLYVQAHCFVDVSMEMIGRSNVTFVTDGHILPLIIIVAKLPRKSALTQQRTRNFDIDN